MGTGNLQTVAERQEWQGELSGKKWKVNSALLPSPWLWYTGDWCCESFWREQGGENEMSSATAVPWVTQQLGPAWCWWAGPLPGATCQGSEMSWEAAVLLITQCDVLEDGCQSSFLGDGAFCLSVESSMLVCKPPLLDKKRLQPGKTTSFPPASSQNCTLLLLNSHV